MNEFIYGDINNVEYWKCDFSAHIRKTIIKPMWLYFVQKTESQHLRKPDVLIGVKNNYSEACEAVGQQS